MASEWEQRSLTSLFASMPSTYPSALKRVIKKPGIQVPKDFGEASGDVSCVFLLCNVDLKHVDKERETHSI